MKLLTALRIRKKQILMMIGDIVTIIIMAVLALMLRFDLTPSSIPDEYIIILRNQIFVIIAVNIVFLWLFKLYNSVWEFAGIDDLLHIVAAAFFAECFVLLYGIMTDSVLPKSFYFIDWVLEMAVIGGYRLALRIYRELSLVSKTLRGKQIRVLLIGAGKMGTMMAEELMNEEYKFGKPVIFVDDDPEKKGRRIKGILIAGSCDEITRLVIKYRIDKIIFCIPTASTEKRKAILELAMGTGCQIKIAQSIHGSLTSDTEKQTTRDVDVADLLDRPVVMLNKDICGYLKDQIVLVTGGGGSIGSELCRQVARCAPKKIVIFDIYENNAYDLQQELRQRYGDQVDVCIRIGSVREIKRLEQVFQEFRPSVVFHAAAHKHVPIMEDNPCEAVKNNIFGTLYTAKTAGKYGVSRFVLLSTDKAVNPTSIMGATKRITEMIIQAVNWHNATIYAAVRFGNVLGSNGSAIPLFKRQIAAGGPVTVTHPDVTRYFMTIPEAAQLVLQAGGLATGGDVFVLDMGEPVRIMDLVYNLIRLSGHEPDADIKIEITGLRPGEKLYEELSYKDEEEGRRLTQNSKIFITPPIVFDTKVFRVQLDNLKKYADDGNAEALYQELSDIIYGCCKGEAEENRLLALPRSKIQTQDTGIPQDSHALAGNM